MIVATATTAAVALALGAAAAPTAPVFDPSGTWTISATGRCFGSAWYDDGDLPLVGDDFPCSRELSNFSPPESDRLGVSYDPVTRTVTLSGGPSSASRRLPLDAEGFGTSTESYRNETGSIDAACEVHSFFTEVVQFKDAHLSYAYVDNSEYIPDEETPPVSEQDVGYSSCDPSIARLRGAVSVGRASPGTMALVRSGALDFQRFGDVRQTSIYYRYDGMRKLDNLSK